MQLEIGRVMEKALCDRIMTLNNVDIYEHSIAAELLMDENNELIDIVRHPRQVVRMKVDKKLSVNDMMRIKKD